MTGRHRVAAVAGLLLITLLAGCLSGDAPEDSGTGTPDGRDPQDPGGTDTDPGAQDGGGGDPGDGGDTGDPGTDPGDEDDADPPPANATGPAPPSEQRKDSVDEITRPGEYARLERRPGSTDAQWTLPTWETDAWWRWRVSVAGGATCAAELTETVTGSATHMGVPHYTMRNENHHCDTGETYKTTDLQRTKAHLTRFQTNGYIEHELLFPIVDGARWVYMNQGETLTYAEVHHRPNYVYGVQALEAWRVTLEYQGRCYPNGDCDEIVKYQYYGVENRHLVKEEIYVNGSSVTSVVIELIDSSADDEGLLTGLGPLP